MPENIKLSLSFLKKSSEKEVVYNHFIRRNAGILSTVAKSINDGLYNIEKELNHSKDEMSFKMYGDYIYIKMAKEKTEEEEACNFRLLRSELFDGVFNTILIKDNTAFALFVPTTPEGVMEIDNPVEIKESELVDQDYRLFNSLRIAIEGHFAQVDENKIALKLKAFFDEAYKEKDVVPTESEKHLDKRAFDIIFYEEDPEQLKSAEYLVKAMLEIAKSELDKKSMLYYTGIAFSKDKMLETVRLVIEKEEDVIYTLDSRNREFYITNRKTLEKITANEFEGSDKEVITFKIAEQLLLAVDGKIEVSEFFNDLVESRK